MRLLLSKLPYSLSLVLVTSGDTGSSAMYAACNIPNIDLIVLYPHNRISALQEIMMTTLEGENLHLFAGTVLVLCLMPVFTFDHSAYEEFRYFTLISHWDQAVCPWPRLTKDLQTEPKKGCSALV